MKSLVLEMLLLVERYTLQRIVTDLKLKITETFCINVNYTMA